jgi:hypothetical protein
MSASAPGRIDGIDFWRGFVLVTIFVNHAPSNLAAFFTHHNFGFSDGAEAFVFLSGLSVALAYGSKFLDGRIAQAIRGMYRRALTLYGVQIAISLAGIVFLVVAAFVLDSDDLTDEPDRAEVIAHPIRAIASMLVLTHQVGFFNILPIYIVFLLAAPAFLALARVDRRLMLLASGALYLLVRYFSFNVPVWPLEGSWFFNPLAWQLIFVIGLYFGLGLRRETVPYNRALFITCVGFLLVSLLVITNALGTWPELWGHARDHIAHDKTGLSAIRLLHFLAIAYVIYHSGLTNLMRTTPLFAPLALMGRHSLPVFAAGEFLTLVGEAITETEIPDFLSQIIIVVGGIAIQFWIARYYEARALRRSQALAQTQETKEPNGAVSGLALARTR